MIRADHAVATLGVDEPGAGAASVAVPGISRSRRFLPELEALRGLAVLLVFLMHANGHLHPLFEPWSFDVSPLAAFVRDARTGVNVFFVLSGFLIALPFVQQARGGRPVIVGEYFTRRALRIVPLYATVVVVATVVTSHAARDLLRAVPFLLFLNGFVFRSPILPWGPVWWSLATEVQFYLLLPLVAWLCRQRRGLGPMLLAAYVVAHVGYQRAWIPIRQITTQILLQESILGRAPLFLGGVAAAIVYDRYGDRLRDRWRAVPWFRNGGADALLVAILAALALFLRWVVGLGGESELPAYQFRDFVDAAAWSTVLLLLLLAPLRTKPLFSNAPLARLGVLSYSVYLIHVPLLFYAMEVLRRRWPDALFYWTPRTVVVVALLGLACVAIAEVTFRTIEQPFLRRKARFDSRAAS